MAQSKKAWDLEAGSSGLVTGVNPSVHTTSQELMPFASRAMTPIEALNNEITVCIMEIIDILTAAALRKLVRMRHPGKRLIALAIWRRVQARKCVQNEE